MALQTATRATRKPPHDSLPTSRKNRQVEKALARDLNRIVNAIRHELPDYRLSKTTELDARVRPLLTPYVLATLRKHMTDSYSLGIDYLTSLPGLRNIPGYVTRSDLEIVKGLADSYSIRFWNRVSKVLSAENTITLNYVKGSATSLLNANYIVNSLAIGATNEPLNLATVTKARVLTGVPALLLTNVAIAQLDDFTFDLPLELELVAEWRTSMDDRVCQICEDLEGEYRLDEQVPQPVEDSHPNCRCRILIEGA